MTIKDFSVGQTAYVLSERKINGKNLVVLAEVIKVGRKYVTVKAEGWEQIRFFESLVEADCLYEDKDYGVKRLLFPTTEAVDEHNELIDLRNWVQQATDWMKVKCYTLAQLRAVKKILEDESFAIAETEEGYP